MSLPFSHEAFLDVFAAYNARLWPVAVLLWLATALMCWRWFAGGHVTGRAMAALLAIHWLVSGLAYHWFFFRAINPTAAAFAAAFILQATVFASLAASGRPMSAAHAGPRRVLGVALVIYGLAYPLFGLTLGLTYPRAPMFGVPCPTTIVTAGVIVSSRGVPRLARLIPLLWAMVGSSAAFALGIYADLALVVAAVVLALDMVAPSSPASTASGRRWRRADPGRQRSTRQGRTRRSTAS